MTAPIRKPSAEQPVTLRQSIFDVVLGVTAAAAAVGARSMIDIPMTILPFFLVVIAVCLVTVAAGLIGGLTTMILGGLLTWHYLLGSGDWRSIRIDEVYSLLGYFSVSLVILGTSQLYRLSARKGQAVELELALQEARHQSLFAREMSHRLKNAMAIIQALSRQSLGDGSPEVAKFEGRLKALADAHNLLNEHVKQPTASVRETVETAIAPCADHEGRFRLSGESTPLPDQQVVNLSLALHELCTNALKYGALREDDGWISILWEKEESALSIELKEHDGPAIVPPKTTGFGTRLLSRSAMRSKLTFESDGLRCRMQLSIDGNTSVAPDAMVRI